MQVVTFATVPKSKPPEYIPAILAMYRYVRDHEPDFKEFKRYLREHDQFDKDTNDELLEFLQIKVVKNKTTVAGNFLPSLAEKGTLEEQQKVLFRHLAKKNEILLKYVMDGLAERLYSTNELYRYITSYVYPGDYITLHHFKAWVDWLQASGHIKMIGIRWGLSTLGEEAMSYIKTIDVEDILEESASAREDEEEDEDEESAGDDDGGSSWDTIGSPADSAAPREAAEAEEGGAAASERESSTAASSTPSTSRAAAAPAAYDEPRTGYAPAQPPAAGNVVYASFGEPQVVMPAGVETVQVVVQPIATVPDETPLKLVRESFEAADAEQEEDEMTGESGPALVGRLEALRVEEDLVGENLRAVLSWWQGGTRGRILRAVDYGFDKESYEADPAFTVYRLACLAVSLFRYQGRLNVGKGGEAFAVLDQMGFFTNAFKSRKSIDKTLDELFAGGLSQRPEVFSNLHYFLLLRRSLKELGDAGVRKLAEEESAAQVVGSLWQHLAHHSLHYEVLFVARELHLMQAWPNEALASVGVIPLPRVRENAFRLGFIETPYAADFPSLVGISRRLSRLFGPNEGFEAPLVFFEPERFVRYGTAEPAYFTRDQLGID